MNINELVKDSYSNSTSHGFWADADLQPAAKKYILSTKLALIHSEISEALEELRDGDLAGDTLIRYTESGKPEGFAPELADAMIRIADLAGYLGIDLDAVITEKMAYNTGRPFMHGRTI